MHTLRLHSFRSFLDALARRWSRRRNCIDAPGRSRWTPQVRTLEPRIVLNATAELVALGDLVISGDAADDLVDVTLNTSGEIEIFDANDAVIPIRVGTDLHGDPILVDSVDPNQIASGRLIVGLGGGDDTLKVDLPTGLSVTVFDDLGNDSVALSLNSDASAATGSTLNLDAENISIDARGHDLELGAGRLHTTGSGGSIAIDHAGTVQLGDISAESGELRIGSESSPLTGDVSQATGTHMEVERLHVRTLGGVELDQTENVIANIERIDSGDDVVVSSDVTSLPGSTLTVDRINVSSGIERGDIALTVIGSVDLVSSDVEHDTILSTDNGEIRVAASADIHIDDHVSSNNTFDDPSNHEIVAGGAHGRLLMRAGGSLVAGDDVQLHASQITDAAVAIDAPGVVLGERFEINTGEGTGVARRFAPRPELEIIGSNPGTFRPVPPGVITNPTDPNYVEIETAFYDGASIETDVLTQANENDAVGVLSVDLGTAGENGLTLSIDWGAETNRFQRIENLAGDHTRVDVSHLYLQSDILNSTLNGRSSATDPLAVRFAVAHHDSIVITGSSIEQAVSAEEVPTAGGPSLQEFVPGGLLTSTDNPATGGLESGRARFVIPRVNVPLAFLPVRDVIPEPIEPSPPVILPSTSELTHTAFDSVQTSASAPAIRDEFFQLRTLSPDPHGEDLIEPIRLPENIMLDDNMEELFAELPDGAYEIEYVVGENDQRTIMQVDLRGGQAVISGGDLEPATLRLEPIEEADPQENLEPESEPKAVPQTPMKKDEHEPGS